MFYFLTKNSDQLLHVSSGKLLSDAHFIHPNRTLDTMVLLVGLHGKVYITQDDREYVLSPNTFLFLFPGHHHFGSRISDADGDTVSYYWCHFRLSDNFYQLLNEDEISRRFQSNRPSSGFLSSTTPLSDYYILPEYGSLYSADRTMLLFNLLLDLSQREIYSHQMLNYAVSLLCMEISQGFYSQRMTSNLVSDKIHYSLQIIMQWISVHYDEDPSVADIAEMFNYNADYLSTVFKRYTGLSLVRYINKAKISEAKRLLLSTDLTVREISEKSGFHNDKHFLKVFKQIEEVTPSQYRAAYCRKNINKE